MTVSSARFGLGISNCRSAAGVVAGVQEAEALGAEAAFVAEDIGCRDAFSLCALAASSTRTIRLGTGVVNPYTRNPMSLAMAVATLDEVSGGRAFLGLGTSSPSLLAEQMGIPLGSPILAMQDTTEIVRRLLTGEVVTHSGSRVSYRDAQISVRPIQPRIPIYYAAMGPRILRLAGRLADGVLLNVGASTEYVRWAVREIRTGCAEEDRDPASVTVAAWLTAYVGVDEETDLRRAREWLATMLSIPRQGELLLTHSGLDLSILTPIRVLVSGYPHRGDPVAAAEHVPPDVARRLTLIGTVDEVRGRLQEYREAGVDLPVLGLPALRALYSGAPGTSSQPPNKEASVRRPGR